jgi:type I restriction enzyme R subunit
MSKVARFYLCEEALSALLARRGSRSRALITKPMGLRKYGYPPDLKDAAVQKVLQQAEVLSADWAA